LGSRFATGRWDQDRPKCHFSRRNAAACAFVYQTTDRVVSDHAATAVRQTRRKHCHDTPTFRQKNCISRLYGQLSGFADVAVFCGGCHGAFFARILRKATK
jgi:hypothetical protein